MLTSGDCLGGGSTTAKPTVLIIRHTSARSVTTHHSWREGQRHTDVYCLSCSQVDAYPKPVAAMCGQLGRHHDRYFGRVRDEITPTMPITDYVTVRGVVDGSPVKLSYDAGAKPEFPWWMRLLAVLRRPSAMLRTAPKCGVWRQARTDIRTDLAGLGRERGFVPHGGRLARSYNPGGCTGMDLP